MRCMKKYVKDNGDHKLSDQVKCLQNRLNSIIKVINKSTTPVHQISWQIQWPVQNPNWSTLKTFWKSKKIPPLSHKNQYGTDFKERADLFNSFAKQCSFINNSSKLPSTFLKRKEKFLWPISFSSNDIPKITWHLHHNKSSWSWYDKYPYAQNLWCAYLKAFRDNFQILYRKNVSFLMNGKKQISFQFIKKVINKCQETTELFHNFHDVEKYLTRPVHF